MTAHAEQVAAVLGVAQDVGTKIGTDCLAAFMRMVFKDSFIHGDLHPGNIMLRLLDSSNDASSSGNQGQAALHASSSGFMDSLPGLHALARRFSGRDPYEIIILDAGLAIPLPPDKVEALRSLAISIIYGDFHRAAHILYDVSPNTSNCQDPVAFKHGLAEAFRNCRKQIYEDGFVQVGDTVLEALRLVREYNVALDTTLTWTLLGMLSIEGSARQLDPEVDCARAAGRYILTLPSLRRELQSQSWHTSKHMLAEMLFNAVGMDYWAWRNTQSLSWKSLVPVR